MCGRMSLAKKDLGDVATTLQASVGAEFVAEWQPRFNIAPTQQHPILRLEDDARWLRPARWGFRRPDQKGLLINARSETVKHLPAFRAAYEQRRCVVPVDGFYEWGATGAKTKATPPTWFHAADEGLLLVAGLWTPGDEAAPPFFTVLTTRPNELVATVHDRMPVLVPPDQVEEWLRVGGSRFFAAAPEGVLAARRVSSRVNSVKNDDLACLQAPPAALTLNV
jgi:putative SOS response-associated peptidase YedK